MGPNEQNQHFAELRQKVCLYIHAVGLLRGLPSLEGKNEFFAGKKGKAVSPTKSDRLYSISHRAEVQLPHLPSYRLKKVVCFL